jgi:hypothetical protein
MNPAEDANRTLDMISLRDPEALKAEAWPEGRAIRITGDGTSRAREPGAALCSRNR